MGLTASVDTPSAVQPAVDRDRQHRHERDDVGLVDVFRQPVGIVEQIDELVAQLASLAAGE